MRALDSACVCCILAKAGPQRSRTLANLAKDERTQALPIFPFLQKVYLERILRQEEVRTGSSLQSLPFTHLASSLKLSPHALNLDGRESGYQP